MTYEQIRQNAMKFAMKETGCFSFKYLSYKKGYIAGARSRNIDEMFESLDPYQKAEFMQRNMEWARNCDLVDELKIRNL